MKSYYPYIKEFKYKFHKNMELNMTFKSSKYQLSTLLKNRQIFPIEKPRFEYETIYKSLENVQKWYKNRN